MSTVQFNLLPDVKLEFYKTQKSKRVVYNLAFLVSIAAVILLVITFLVANVAQKKALSDADKDITKYSNQLQNTPDLEKILTVQNQLNALPALHKQKHVLSRLFDYIPSVTPKNISIGKLDLDTTNNDITITGTADKVETVNQFVDTLKFTSYTTSDITHKSPAFKSVVLTTIGRDQTTVSYVIDATYDPVLFQAGENVKLIVPQELTTRSITESPNSSLFNGQTGQSTKTSDNVNAPGGQ